MGVSVSNPSSGAVAVAPKTVTLADVPDSGGQAPANNQGVIVHTGRPGPRGAPGGASNIYEYQMPMPSTVATIDHDLGRDPVAVQVFEGGVACDEFSVFFTIPGEQVQIGFDISVAAFIRLL